MRRFLSLILCLWLASPAWAAVTATTQWECQTTGSDGNGGGFDPTVSGGVDYTQGANQKTITFNGATLTASNSGASATITINGGYTVLAGDAGNVVNITSGTNFTAGRYLITTVNTGTNTWTLDRNCTTGAGSAMVGVAGGALASPGGAAGVLATSSVGANGQTVNVKSGTYTIGTGTANTSGNRVNTSVSATWWGYGTTHGDSAARPILAAGGGSITLFTTAGGAAILLRNFEFQAGGQTSVGGVTLGSANNVVQDCKCTSLNSTAFTGSGGNNLLVNCEASGSSGAGNFGFNFTGGGTRYLGCTAHGGSVTGFQMVHGDCAVRCISYANSAHGFTIVATGAGASLVNCLSYGNTGANVSGYSTGQAGIYFVGCLAINNGTSGSCYGFTTTGGNNYLINCGAYGNVTADTSGTWQITGFQSLSGDPTVNGAGGNFALNTTGGAGAKCRAAGWPSSWPGLSGTTGYPDIGPVQSKATSGQAVAF